jgi:hypothetical protein
MMAQHAEQPLDVDWKTLTLRAYVQNAGGVAAACLRSLGPQARGVLETHLVLTALGLPMEPAERATILAAAASQAAATVLLKR